MNVIRLFRRSLPTGQPLSFTRGAQWTLCAPPEAAAGVRGTGQPGARVARAAEIKEQLKVLAADLITHAFRRGDLLIEAERDDLYGEMGVQNQEQLIKAIGMKRSTAMSDKRLALKFDLAAHRHIGLGKLRLLAANYNDDPVAAIYEGIEAPDGTLVAVETATYRELQHLFSSRKKAASKSALAFKIQEVGANLLGSVAGGRIQNADTADRLPARPADGPDGPAGGNPVAILVDVEPGTVVPAAIKPSNRKGQVHTLGARTVGLGSAPAPG